MREVELSAAMQALWNRLQSDHLEQLENVVRGLSPSPFRVSQIHDSVIVEMIDPDLVVPEGL